MGLEPTIIGSKVLRLIQLGHETFSIFRKKRAYIKCINKIIFFYLFYIYMHLIPNYYILIIKNI